MGPTVCSDEIENWGMNRKNGMLGIEQSFQKLLNPYTCAPFAQHNDDLASPYCDQYHFITKKPNPQLTSSTVY
jgi:hypothetical protein